MRRKIFEYNPNTDVIRWRYEDESHDDIGVRIIFCLLYTSDAADE